ncbi:MAG: hypothetical protein K6G16_08725 [Lachnospiraceae bacterium]|nr:hypothetical protein [Lachnospiraceae bacterium]
MKQPTGSPHLSYQSVTGDHPACAALFDHFLQSSTSEGSSSRDAVSADKLFAAALAEDPELAARLLFLACDGICGLGSRDRFYTLRERLDTPMREALDVFLHDRSELYPDDHVHLSVLAGICSPEEKQISLSLASAFGSNNRGFLKNAYITKDASTPSSNRPVLLTMNEDQQLPEKRIGRLCLSEKGVSLSETLTLLIRHGTLSCDREHLKQEMPSRLVFVGYDPVGEKFAKSTTLHRVLREYDRRSLPVPRLNIWRWGTETEERRDSGNTGSAQIREEELCLEKGGNLRIVRINGYSDLLYRLVLSGHTTPAEIAEGSRYGEITVG